MPARPQNTQEPPVAQPTAADFQGRQLDLFRAFLCNTEEERDRLSNTFDLWDGVPRYAVSRQQQDKWHKAKAFPLLHKIPFHYRGRALIATIQPAAIEHRDGTIRAYYPSANEELVEDALRKIAAEQLNAFFDKPNFRSGVVFTLYMLREELKKRGHARSYQEIVLSLKILARSSIEILAADGKKGEGFTLSGYLSGLSAVSRDTLAEDPQAKWIAQFHPLVTQAIDAVTYRQFNYAHMMGHRTQLARWLHKQLSLKFTFASVMTSFEMRYSTVKRDSALLEGYRLDRQAIAKVDEAFDELKTSGVLLNVSKRELRGPRARLDDVVYILAASLGFIAEMKASNKRHSAAAPPWSPPPGTTGPVDNLPDIGRYR